MAGLAEDLGVSGAVGTFDRPQLGPRLARADEWDGLIVAKYDQLTRSLLDFLVLYKWLSHRQRACELPWRCTTWGSQSLGTQPERYQPCLRQRHGFPPGSCPGLT